MGEDKIPRLDINSPAKEKEQGYGRKPRKFINGNEKKMTEGRNS